MTQPKVGTMTEEAEIDLVVNYLRNDGIHVSRASLRGALAELRTHRSTTPEQVPTDQMKVLASALSKFAPDLMDQLAARWKDADGALEDFLLFLRPDAVTRAQTAPAQAAPVGDDDAQAKELDGLADKYEAAGDAPIAALAMRLAAQRIRDLQGEVERLTNGEKLPDGVDPTTYVPPEDGWVCFHCGVRFTHSGPAIRHFGERPGTAPLCQISKRERDEAHAQLAVMAGALKRIRDKDDCNSYACNPVEWPSSIAGDVLKTTPTAALAEIEAMREVERVARRVVADPILRSPAMVTALAWLDAARTTAEKAEGGGT